MKYEKKNCSLSRECTTTNPHVLKYAAINGRIKVVHYLLERDADKEKDNITGHNVIGITPLLRAGIHII